MGARGRRFESARPDHLFLPGCAASYEDVAARFDAPGAVRAVGNAVARNPAAFLIRCHRAIWKTGSFADNQAGTARKKAILAWEAARFRKRDARAGA